MGLSTELPAWITIILSLSGSLAMAVAVVYNIKADVKAGFTDLNQRLTGVQLLLTERIDRLRSDHDNSVAEVARNWTDHDSIKREMVTADVCRRMHAPTADGDDLIALIRRMESKLDSIK